MEAGERAEEAGREKEAGNDAYRKLCLETAVHHYTRGALLDPSDISFLTNRAAAFLLMGKYRDCVRDFDEAVERGRELRADNKLIARALSRKAEAMLKLAGCAEDYAPAIRALQQSLAEHYSEETLAKLVEAESARKELEELIHSRSPSSNHSSTLALPVPNPALPLPTNPSPRSPKMCSTSPGSIHADLIDSIDRLPSLDLPHHSINPLPMDLTWARRDATLESGGPS